jgi:hypothetical protein
MPKQTLSDKLYFDPSYAELAKVVGYMGIPYPTWCDEHERLNAKHGEARIMAVADELIEHDSTTKMVKLKDGVRKLCRQLLGPSPEEWDDYYTGIENPPPNPYKSAESIGKSVSQRIRPQTKHLAKVQCPRADAEDGRQQNNSAPAPKRTVPPPELTVEEMLQKLDDKALLKLLQDARHGQDYYGPKSREGRQFKKDAVKAEAECRRRGLADTATKDAGNLDPSAEAFRKSTTHRLLELVDLNRYELAKYAPDTVTYQEAARDIGFIGAELRRREASAKATRR